MQKRIKCSFPQEVVEGILVNLPVKSLLRFKCVSKPWRCSISSRGFAREHLKKSKSATSFAHHKLIFQFAPCDRVSLGSDYLPVARFMNPISAGSCSIGPLLTDNTDDYQPNSNCDQSSIPTPIFEDNTQLVCLLGSCDGLILISDERSYHLYLWNPSTRKAKNILKASFPEIRYREPLICGLGYDELTDDYKVVSTFSGCQGQMFMYSCRTDSWKRIRDMERGYKPQSPFMLFVNGRLHWPTKEGDGDGRGGLYGDVRNIRWNIVSLDLVEGDKKYQIMAPPPHLVNLRYHELALKELAGYLSFIYYKQPTMDVWVMKKESWSKIWTFSYRYGRGLPMPIWLKKNGDIVVTFGSHVVVYRGEDKLRQSLDRIYSQLGSLVYVESLVAPISL